MRHIDIDSDGEVLITRRELESLLLHVEGTYPVPGEVIMIR